MIIKVNINQIMVTLNKKIFLFTDFHHFTENPSGNIYTGKFHYIAEFHYNYFCLPKYRILKRAYPAFVGVTLSTGKAFYLI